MGPDPPSPAGGDRSGESAAIGRKWVGAGAVLVHDSQGGSARAVAQRLLLTRPWMSPGCWRQPYEDPTGHLDGSSCMGHAVGYTHRQWRPVVSSYPGSVAISRG